MTTFEIIRTVIKRQRFIVEATDPGDAMMRFTRGEALRSSDTIDTQVIAFERPASNLHVIDREMT